MGVSSRCWLSLGVLSAAAIANALPMQGRVMARSTIWVSNKFAAAVDRPTLREALASVGPTLDGTVSIETFMSRGRQLQSGGGTTLNIEYSVVCRSSCAAVAASLTSLTGGSDEGLAHAQALIAMTTQVATDAGFTNAVLSTPAEIAASLALPEQVTITLPPPLPPAVDPCATGPCFSGVTCTAGIGAAFTCGSCPARFTGDGATCTPLPSCDVAIDLATVSSPLTGTTNGATNVNTETTTCGGNGNEAIFSAVVQPGEQIDIGMDANGYDSRHETKWGGACPGTTTVTCTDDPDTSRHTWTNDQTTAQTVYFTIDAYSSGSGSYTLSWSIGAPPPTSCELVTALSGVTSPYSGATSAGPNTHSLSCGGNGQEALFVVVIAPGASLDIGQASNTYDSRHETRWGGDCPGINSISCTDDPDISRHTWTNDQSQPQSVYFAIDAYSSGSGDFVLDWTATCPAGFTGDGATCTDGSGR